MVKVKLSLYLINYALCHDHTWENGGIAPLFFTSALDGGEWSALCRRRFILGLRAPDTDWVGPGTSLDAVDQRKILALAGNRTSAVQPVDCRYTDRAMPAPQ
jgi:hypothetical protein